MRAWLLTPTVGDGSYRDPYRSVIADSPRVSGDRHEYIGLRDRLTLCAVDVATLEHILAIDGVRPLSDRDACVIGQRHEPAFVLEHHLAVGEPPPVGSFVSDSFTDTSGTTLASHVGEVGAAWTLGNGAAGAAAISNANRARGTNSVSSDTYYYASGVPATPDYSVQADYVFVTNGTVDSSICGRMATGSHSFYLAQYIDAVGLAHQWRLVSATPATTYTQLGTFSQTPAVNAVVTAVLSMVGPYLTLFAAGAAILSATDTAVTAAGRAGVRLPQVGDSDTVGVHLDNFAASNYDVTLSPHGMPSGV